MNVTGDPTPRGVRNNALAIAGDLVRKLDGPLRPLACEAAKKLLHLDYALEELHDAIEKCVRDQRNGYDVLASASWDRVRELWERQTHGTITRRM